MHAAAHRAGSGATDHHQSAVIDVDGGTLILRETAPGVTTDEVRHTTATNLDID
ncbi:MAG: hypothetical protein ACLPXZ_13250 [Mycobacterium sp.]|uniref:hypothetical protein n=1 Tax=Mycobacterium sp. TaxID=1785 RepID=UPI003C75443B